MKNKKTNTYKKICTLTLSSLMVLGTIGTAYGAPIEKLNNVKDNSIVIGQHLFELDRTKDSNYNLNTFVDAAKTVEGENSVYYKYNGKWYTGKDIENFNNLKNAKGIDTIPNDITKVNGKDVNLESQKNFELDWYLDGDYSHDADGENESPEQFVVYFNKPIKNDKGIVKIIVPDQTKKDPYGKDKLGVIEFSLDGSSESKALENIEGGSPVTCFKILTSGKDKTIPKGYTDRFVFELTEDWTRILNTEKTGINYYDIKGLKLVAEGFEGIDGVKVEDEEGTGKIVAKRDINLEKDDQKPFVVTHKPIYTKIGENGNQPAGKTRIVFNEPIQLITNSMIEDLKKEGLEQPCIVGSYNRGKYLKYNPITPNQEQLKSLDKGIPVFQAEYRKVNKDGTPVLDEKNQPIIVKGEYGLTGDIFDNGAENEENGDKLKLRFNDIDFKYDFDPNNSGISRFRDFGMVNINPEKSLSEGHWQLFVKNVTDDVGNKMDDYLSESFEVEKYFDVIELTETGAKIKFLKPYKKTALWGNKLPVVVNNGEGKPISVGWAENIEDGATYAEAKFKAPVPGFKELQTVYINSMKYDIKDITPKTEK